MFNQQNFDWAPPSADYDSRSSFDGSDGEASPKSTIGEETSGLDNIFVPAKVPPTAVSLQVVRQPEEQHRARYLSEGSRGAVKDRSGKSYCTVQLHGYSRPTRLEIFAGSGEGPISPNLLYRVIRVSGKGGNSLTTPCREIVASDGLPCLEVVLRPEYNMTAVLDCVGILKICSHSVKRRAPRGGKSSSVRLIFRAVVPDPAHPGHTVMLQTQTQPVVCVQQLGCPEVLKTSIQSAPARGGVELFVIGRNFDRNTSVMFREYKEDGKLAWSAEAALDPKLLHQCHLVCSVPTYRDLAPSAPTEVSFTVKCGKKTSHPIPFYYQAEAKYNPYEWMPACTATSQAALMPQTSMAPMMPQTSMAQHPVVMPQTSVGQTPAMQDELSTLVDMLKDDTPIVSTAPGLVTSTPTGSEVYIHRTQSETDWATDSLTPDLS